MFFNRSKQVEIDRQNETLRYQEAELTSISRACAVIYFSPQGDILEANSKFLDCVGYTERELIGHHHSILCPEEVREAPDYQRFWAELASGATKTGSFFRKRKDGSDLWIEATYIPVLLDGTVIKVMKIANDVTQEQQNSLKDKALVDAIQRSNAVIEFTNEGVIVEANNNFVRAMGYQAAREIVGKHHRIFCSDDFYRSNPSFWEDLAKGHVKNGLFQRIGKSGNTVWIEATYNPVFNADGRVVKVIKVASDVTERTERQLAIQKAAEVAHSTSVETAQVSERGAGILQENLNNSEKISVDIRRSSELVDELNDQSAEISKIVTTIKGIADQTNLLALNAAIEAARAGEHGRGFAVVADEVRTLASRTTKSTEEIHQMVERNSQLVHQARGSMIEVTEQAGKNADLISEASAIIKEILKGADYVSDVVGQLVNRSAT